MSVDEKFEPSALPPEQADYMLRVSAHLCDTIQFACEQAIANLETLDMPPAAAHVAVANILIASGIAYMQSMEEPFSLDVMEANREAWEGMARHMSKGQETKQ